MLRGIRQSPGRFIAIFAIVALGVGFLAGLLATTPDIQASVDRYYDDNHMADIVIKGSMGLTDADIEAVSSLEGVGQVLPARVTDILMKTGGNEVLATRIYGLPFTSLKVNDRRFINRLELMEGRIPRSENECLAERSGGHLSSLLPGETLTISEDNADYDKTGDTYHRTQFTVVGIVGNPYYFSMERESTNSGSGRLGAIIYVDESAYSIEAYTDLLLTVPAAKKLNAFSDEYDRCIKEVAARIEAVGESRSILRRQDVKREARSRLDKVKGEYESAKLDAQKELADARQKLIEGRAELSDALQVIIDGKAKIQEAEATLRKETANARNEISRGRQKLRDSLIKLKEGEEKYGSAESKLKEGQRKYDAGMTKYSASRKELLDGQAQFDAAEKEYREGVGKLSASGIKASEAHYRAGIQQLRKQKNQFDRQLEPILHSLKNSGFPFTTSADLCKALQKDDTGRIGAAIDEAAARQGLSTGAAELRERWQALRVREDELKTEAEEIQYARSEYAKTDLDEVGKEIEKYRPQLSAGWAKLEKGRLELDKSRIQLQEGYSRLAEARETLDNGWSEYHYGLGELADGENALKRKTVEAEKEINRAKASLAQGETDYEKGLRKLSDSEAEYIKGKKEAEKKLRDGAAKIADAERRLEDMAVPRWYVLDRHSNVSYESFSRNSEKIASIVKVFPIFFILIATLVALTTMIRMVEEERIQIGTLRALGYTKSGVMNKYVIYCGLASALGSISGLAAGFNLLPPVLFNAFAITYHLPAFQGQFNPGFALAASMIAILSTMGSTVWACQHSLKEKPAALMIPRAPRAGKRIFLEYIPVIWSCMKFSYKATARNLIRNKRHFFMTVMGIAGCTALIVTGFGLRDSVGDIARTQFNEITGYDLMIELSDTAGCHRKLDGFLRDPQQVKSYTQLMSEAGCAKKNDIRIQSTIYVPGDSPALNEYVTLRDRKSGEKILFSKSSVVITENLADALGIHGGDTFGVENADGETAQFILTAVTENYVGSYVYLNRGDYERAFGRKPVENVLLVKTQIDKSDEDSALSRMLSSDCVSNAVFVSQIRASFDHLMSSINYIVIVLILAAGALAVIVLFNLTNVNINERRKELATLKALGFHNEEVAGYIFRENTILTVIGTFLGLGLGIVLHAFVIKTSDTAELMFGRSISLSSFVLSVAVTLLFSSAVNLLMYKILKNIEMVDSMKAVD